MKKTLYIIHGWGDNPKLHWYPWLKQKIEEKGWEVIIPEMPNTEEPIIEEWVGYIQDLIKKPDINTYFVGHSIGCQAILRYFETLKKIRIGGLIFVAGWFILKNLESEAEKDIAQPWLETPIDFTQITQITQNITAVFSDNDPYVAMHENIDLFKEKLHAKILIEHNKGHMVEEHGVIQLPCILDILP